MLSEKVTILACEAGTLTLQSQRKTTCQSCEMRKGCGQYLLDHNSAAFALAPGTYKQDMTIDGQPLKAGSQVELQVGASTLVIVTLLFYMLPLGFLIVGLLIGLAFSLSEPMLVVLSFAGLAAGVIISRKCLAQYQQKQLVGINMNPGPIKS